MNPEPAVLFVDDEEKALKYFRLALEKEFRVLTASGAPAALDRVRDPEEEIGVLVTDQRMPGRSGVDLLGEVRRTHPRMMRMLTTAYSDLESAIRAVNTGAIYKYIVKPWDLQELRADVRRAMDYYKLQQERDALLREKVSVLQRMLVADRVRSLSTMAAGLAHHIRNAMTALYTFVEQAPDKLREELPGNARVKDPQFWEVLARSAQANSRAVLDIVERVVDATAPPRYKLNEPVDLAACCRRAATGPFPGGARAEVENPEALPAMKGDPGMVTRLLRLLLEKTARLSPKGSRVTVRVAGGRSLGPSPAVACGIRSSGPAWSRRDVAGLFVPLAGIWDDPRDLGLDLLPAFFMTHHHGGDLRVHAEPPEGPGFDLLLPLDPENVERPDVQEEDLEDLLTGAPRDAAG